VDCSFQNDHLEYITAEYMKGNERTTGIARFNNKFAFTAPVPYGTGYIFTLTPTPDSDYDFYVDFHGTTCPTILTRTPEVDGCSVTLDYNGTSEIKLGTKILNFNISDQTIESLPYGTYELTTNGNSCLIITCQKVNEITQVVLSTPDFKLITDDSLSVLGDLTLFNNLTETIQSVNDVISQLDLTNEQIANIGKALSLLDFNVTDKFEFEDFSELRAEVDALTNTLASTRGDQKLVIDFESCDSVFGSVKCFLENMLLNLIAVGLIIACAVVAYVLIFKLKICKKMCKK